MIIKKLNADQLASYINSEEFKTSEHIPITKQRALSHVNNPRVSPDDNLLYLAYIDGKMQGYRLVLAENVFQNGQAIKIGWFSCVWVNPKLRGKGIAKALVNEALKDWDDKIILVDAVKESEALYMRTGKFDNSTYLEGINAYLKLDLANILPKKYPWLSYVRLLLTIIDYVGNGLTAVSKLSKSYVFDSTCTWEYTSQFDDDVKQYISSANKHLWMRRGAAEFAWIKEFPWILEGKGEQCIIGRYYFSSSARRFKYYFIKLVKDAKVQGFLVLTLRNDRLKLSYAFYNSIYLKDVANIIYKHSIDLKVKAVSVLDTELVKYMKNNKHPFIFIKPRKKQYLVSKKLIPLMPSSFSTCMQEGDGDSIFT